MEQSSHHYNYKIKFRENTKLDKDKIKAEDILKYKNMMIKQLGELYIHPREVEIPKFFIQNIVSYDEYGDIIYIPFVATNMNALYLSGYLKGLPKGFISLLEAIILHMDQDGFAFPSIDRLVLLTGISKSTVINYLNAIANREINGTTILYKQTIKRGQGEYDINLYYIPESIVAFNDSDDLISEEEKLNKLANNEPVVFLPELDYSEDNMPF